MASVVINEKICDYLIFFKSDKIGIIIHTELCVRVNDCHLVELLLWTGTGTCVCLCVCGGTHLESRLNGSVGRVLSPSSIRSGDRPCWHRWHTHTHRHLFQQSVLTHTHKHFDSPVWGRRREEVTEKYPRWSYWGYDAPPPEPSEVPGNQKQMLLLRISTVNPPIPLFLCCVRTLRKRRGGQHVYLCVFFCFSPHADCVVVLVFIRVCFYVCVVNRQHILWIPSWGVMGNLENGPTVVFRGKSMCVFVCQCVCAKERNCYWAALQGVCWKSL